MIVAIKCLSYRPLGLLNLELEQTSARQQSLLPLHRYAAQREGLHEGEQRGTLSQTGGQIEGSPPVSFPVSVKQD